MYGYYLYMRTTQEQAQMVQAMRAFEKLIDSSRNQASYEAYSEKLRNDHSRQGYLNAANSANVPAVIGRRGQYGAR